MHKRPTKEFLEKEYLECQKTLAELGQELHVDKSTIREWLIAYQIPRRKACAFGTRHPCYGKPNNWGSHTEETKRKLSETHSGSSNSMYGKFGSEHGAWKQPDQRKTPLYKSIRFCTEYKKWRVDVFKRDDYTCQQCGKKGGILNADHIIPLCVLMKTHKITSLELARSCGNLWETNNGQTLCVQCHKTTNSYSKKLITYEKEMSS